MMVYNWTRAGNPFQTGYDLTIFSPSLAEGLYKLLLSPLRGLFWFSPVLMLSLFAFYGFARRHLPEALLTAGIVGANVLLFSAWTSGEGLSWGSRFMVPVLAFWALPLIEPSAGDIGCPQTGLDGRARCFRRRVRPGAGAGRIPQPVAVFHPPA